MTTNNGKVASFGDSRLPSRFWAKVEADASGCWLWIACRNPAGYGLFSVSNRSRLAHRHAYQTLVGVTGTGLVSDHLCRVRHCVNPAHIEPVTDAVNLARGDVVDRRKAQAALQTHCKRGHLLSGDNLRGGQSSRRACKACHRDLMRARRASLA